MAATQLNIDSLSVDGAEIRSLSCQIDKGSLLASMSIGAAIAAQKEALDLCAPKGAAFSVSWTWRGDNSTSEVLKSSDESARNCIGASIATVQAPLQGTCSAFLLTGDIEQAEIALQKLLTKAQK